MPRTVLIVDDSAPFRITAQAVLEARGYAVVGAVADAAGALAAAGDLQPDAVLLDVNLPDMDGVAVARKLTANGLTPAVVLVSTLDASALGVSIASSGARGFVPKTELGSPRLVELLGAPEGST